LIQLVISNFRTQWFGEELHRLVVVASEVICSAYNFLKLAISAADKAPIYDMLGRRPVGSDN
jgi:hypothetical protein